MLLCALVWACAGEHATGGNPPPPDSVGVQDSALHLERVKADGDEQEGIVGRDMLLPLIVRVMNGNNPVSGLFVEWRSDFPGAVLNPGLAQSGPNGLAITHYTAGPTAGNQIVTASLNGKTEYFQLLARPESADAITPVLGNGDSATASLSIAVRITDKFGNGVPDIPVDWEILSGDVVFSFPPDPTLYNGVGGAVLIFGSTKGSATISAAVPGLSPALFHVYSY